MWNTNQEWNKDTLINIKTEASLCSPNDDVTKSNCLPTASPLGDKNSLPWWELIRQRVKFKTRTLYIQGKSRFAPSGSSIFYKVPSSLEADHDRLWEENKVTSHFKVIHPPCLLSIVTILWWCVCKQHFNIKTSILFLLNYPNCYMDW